MDEEAFETGFDTGYDSCLGDIQFQMGRLSRGEIELEAFLRALREGSVNEL